MDELVQRCASRIKLAILIGTDAPKIAEALNKYAPEIPQHHITGSLSPAELMKEVVKIAAQSALSGDVILLAPACASMDQFKNYAERGDLFAAAVKEHVGV
jgi:UDP-N-acetylmuramoylalanine--D-glutamate ligase